MHSLPRYAIWAVLSFIAALLIVTLALSENIKLILLPVVLFSGLWMINKPKLLAFIFILATTDFVGFINPEQFVNLPGVFKFIDLIYLITMLVLAMDVFKNGFFWPARGNKSRAIYTIVLVFFIMVVLQIFATSIRFDLPIISSLKVGRGYFYIIFFFYLNQFFKDENSCCELLMFLVGVCILQFIFLTLQIFGIDIGASNIIRKLDVGNHSVTRVYIPAMFTAMSCFSVSLMLFLERYDYKNIVKIVLIITLLSLMLSFNRTYWGAVFYSVMLICFFGSPTVSRNALKYGFLSAIFVVPVLLSSDSGSIIFERLISIFSEVGSDEGNFIYRFSENPQRIDAFISNPLLGPGFVHSDYAASIFNFILDLKGLSESQIERALLLQTNDSGWITLLVSFGLIGVLWVIIKKIILIKNIILYSSKLDVFYRSLLIGNSIFVVAIWLSSVTTYGFTYSDGIVSLATSMYFISSSLKHIKT